MKCLLIGGTGQISMAVTKKLLLEGWDVTLLNRGNRLSELPAGAKILKADMGKEEEVAAVLEGRTFDCVCEFIAFTLEQVRRDVRLFTGKTKQYIFISTASAYHKPANGLVITEGTSLANPYWQYSRDKIACEDYLMEEYRKNGFPVTIVRPSHTYDEKHVPLGLHGKKGFYQVLLRMLEGKPVIIHGDGTSLWTVTHNSDFAQGYVGLMGNSKAIGEAFGITSGEALTWNQIYGCIADALGVELHPYHVSSEFLAAVGGEYDFTGSLLGDKAETAIFDMGKLKKLVPEFAPKMPFYKGVRLSLEYILSHPECQVKDPEFDAWCDRVIDGMEELKKKLCEKEK